MKMSIESIIKTLIGSVGKMKWNYLAIVFLYSLYISACGTSYQVRTEPIFGTYGQKYEGIIGLYLPSRYLNYVHNGPFWTVEPTFGTEKSIQEGLRRIAKNVIILESPTPPEQLHTEYLFTVIPDIITYIKWRDFRNCFFKGSRNRRTG